MWNIYDKNGVNVKCVATELEYNGTWMGETYVTVTIKSPTPIDFAIGDYLVYRGERFEINYNPAALKKAKREKTGDAFTYDKIKFNSLSGELTRCDFLDIVLEDNHIHYTSLPKFSFFAASIQDLADRIQANLNRLYTGDRTWTIEVHPEYANKTNVNIDVQNIKVWDALELCVEEFGAYFIIRGRHIIIGTAGIATEHLFQFGKGRGLYEILQESEGNQQIITRVRAFGNTTNMPYRYYNKLSNASLENYLPNNMAVNHLMLPGFPETTLDPYVDSPNISVLGVRESTIFFDGSNDMPDIHPSLEGVTAALLRDAGYNVILPSGDNGNLDELAVGYTPTDDGEWEEGADIPNFAIRIKDVGFDINDYLTSENAVIAMKSGMCGGREFTIEKCVKVNGGYELICRRIEDSGIGLTFPNKFYGLSAGDKFVLLHIEMPDVYIKAASQRLLEATQEWLSKNDYTRFTYSPKVDDIFMARQHDEAMASNGAIESIHDTIKEGNLMLFEDEDLMIDANIVIDNLIIKEGSSSIPKYTVTLRNEKSVGTIEKIQNQISSIVAGQGGGGFTTAQIRDIIAIFGKERFVSKITDDTAQGIIKFSKHLEFGRYFAGAEGGYMGMTENGSLGEVDFLKVRRKAQFETLEIANVKSVGGKLVVSPGDGVEITDVEETEDGYKCYYCSEQTDSDGTSSKIDGRYRVGDQIYSETTNASQGENTLINNYWWRLCIEVGDGYFIVSKTECDFNSGVPMIGDRTVQLGSQTDANRQGAILLSTIEQTSNPVFQMLSGINTFSLIGCTRTEIGVDDSGRAFIKLGSETQYLHYSEDDGLEISGKLAVNSTIGGKTIDQYIQDNAATDMDAVQSLVDAVKDDLQNQIDGAIETWYYEGEPTLLTLPTSEWDTDEDKNKHIGDLYYDKSTGKAYRFLIDDGEYQWVIITDTDIEAALAAASEAQDTADGKRRVFTGTPYTPYDGGDLWVQGESGDIMVCVNSRQTGLFNDTDWEKASKYTDDTYAKGFDYLKDALKDTTTIDGGLILTSVISLGENNENIGSHTTYSGVSGVYDETKPGNGLVLWAGGDAIDKAKYYDFSTQTHTWIQKPDIKPSEIANARIAKTVIRMDGSAYFADGNMVVTNDGKIYYNGLQLYVDNANLNEYLNLFTPNKVGDRITSISTRYPITELKIGSETQYVTLTVDDSGALKIDGTGAYTTGYLSAFGKAPSSGGTVIPDIDLTNYFTKQEVLDLIGNIELGEVEVNWEDYYTKTETDNKLSSYIKHYGSISQQPTPKASGMYYIFQQGGSMGGDGATNGMSIVAGLNGQYGFQLQGSYDGNGHVYVRGLNAGVWQPWVRLATVNDVPTSVPWSAITSKPTTLSGYGITDAFTKTEVNTKLSGYLPLTGGTVSGDLTVRDEFECDHLITGNVSCNNIDCGGIDANGDVTAVGVNCHYVAAQEVITDYLDVYAKTTIRSAVYECMTVKRTEQGAYGAAIRFEKSDGTKLGDVGFDGSNFFNVRNHQNVCLISAVCANGYVGIGTASPLYKLDVAGTMRVVEKRIYFGDSSHYIELTADGSFHFSHGVYSDGFVSAFGKATASGGSGGSTPSLDNYYTKAESNVRYYTKQEVNDMLSGYAQSADYVTTSTLNTRLQSYATTATMNATLQSYTTKDYLTSTLNSYATKEYANAQISDAYVSLRSEYQAAIADFTTQDYVAQYVGERLEYYLPLSGGTVTGQLKVQNLVSNQYINAVTCINAGAYMTTGTYLTVGTDLTVNNNATVNNDLTVNKKATVKSGLSVIGSLTVATQQVTTTDYKRITLSESSITVDAGNNTPPTLELKNSQLRTQMVNGRPTLTVTEGYAAVRAGAMTVSSLLSEGYVTAYGTASTSDSRLKCDLEDVSLDVSAIASAPLITHGWVGRKDLARSVGTIAQYWRSVLPEAVSEGEWLSLDYGKLATACAISMAREIERLRTELNEIKQRI